MTPQKRPRHIDAEHEALVYRAHVMQVPFSTLFALTDLYERDLFHCTHYAELLPQEAADDQLKP